MSLREELLELLPDNVYAVRVDRKDHHGMKAIHVVVNYRDPAGKPWFLDMNFAEKNKMDAEAMAAVLRSYLKYDVASSDNWESEGGNGTHRQ